MKKIFIILLLFPFAMFSQSQTENYTETRTYKIPTTTPISEYDKDKVLSTIQYFDGLGRLKQTVGIEAGGKTVSKNVIPIDWTLNNTATAFYNRNGAASENKVINGTTPLGNTNLLWQCIPDASSNADGGWNTRFFSIDNTKTYQYAVWVKRTGSQAGTTYHGTQNVNNLNGTENNNPYFWAGDLPQLNTWYLMVGIVHPHSYTGGDIGLSGVYDINGNKVIDGTEYKWRPGLNQTRFRNYLYYCTDTAVRQYFWSPIAQVVDGTELSIIDMVRRKSTLITEEKASDIVTHVAYDDFGRQVKEYLPFADQANNADIRIGDIEQTTQRYYQQKYEADFAGVSLPTDINAYSEKDIEDSPLGRVNKQAAPGTDWKLGNGHEIKFDYDANLANEVKIYKVTTSFANNTYIPTLQGGTNYYSQGRLYKTVTKDENWTSGQTYAFDHTTEEFKNKSGQLILKRTYNKNQKHDTYYVYDDFGNLTYVIPPKAEGTVSKPNATKLNELCYQYVYDYRNRLVEKKIPGKGWEYIVYNKLDQPVMTQDTNLKAKNQWLITKYDNLGRVVYTGHQSNSSSRVSLQNAANGTSYTQWEIRQSTSRNLGGTNIYYTSTAIPSGLTQVYTVNYYDTYIDLPLGYKAPTSVYNQNVTTNTKGLATVSKVRVLNTNSWITTITYYDQKGRPIYVYSDNPYLETVDILESKLDDFTGKVLETKTTHKKTGKTDIVTVDRFEYDHMDRLVSQAQQINDQISERIVKNNYDDLGLMESKILGNGTKVGYTDVTSGLSIAGNKITKTGSNGWSHGLATKGTINSDGYTEYRIPQINRALMVGLSSDNSSASYNTIDFAIYCRSNGTLGIYESGIHVNNPGNYKAGDLLRIERIGSTIFFKKNSETIYISQTKSAGNLIGDISIHGNGGKITDFKIVDNSQGLQKVDYDYNVRGWLTAINEDGNNDNDLFNFSLKYNTGSDASKYLYNGNIAQTTWQTQNTNVSTRSYVYGYDALNRITDATGTKDDRYDVGGIIYDKNGNILNLMRKGHTTAAAITFSKMDDLVYTYDSGNKLQKVTDRVTSPTTGFKDGSNTGNDYSYDANGNMKTDANKGVTNINYNHLNLPSRVTIAGKNIDYKYDATGMKLRKTVNGVTTDYAGNHIYENGILQFFNHSEGYVENTNGTFNYVYQYKDHLGNIRLSFTDSDNDGEITAPTTEIFYDDASNTGGWDSVGALYGSSTTVDDKHTVSGGKAIKLSKNGSGEVYAHSNNWIAINNTVATDYIFSGWIYIEAPSSAYGRIMLFMNENEETGYFTQIVEAPRMREANKWLYVEKRVTVPANIDKLNLRLDIYTGGSKVEGWFDDLRVTKVNDASYSEIVEEKNYYPFGLQQKGYNNAISSLGNSAAQKFGYNGKEFNDEVGLKWHDFGARNYDASLGRWMNVDPLADDLDQIHTSAYSAFWNNPITYNDPTGMKPEDDYGLDKKTGKLIFLKETDSDTDTIYTGEITGMNSDGTDQFEKDGGSKTFKKGSSNIKEITTVEDKNGKVVQDIGTDASVNGLVFSEGNLQIGLEVMEFISFQTYKELNAWGFETDKGQGLFISPWDKNTAILSKDFVSAFSDSVISPVGAKKNYGKKIGKVHTHPGDREGNGGYGEPSGRFGIERGDLYKKNQGVNSKYPHYIISRHDGWTDY